jgi:D-glycero-alpha-D-manno-heptose 1-phosphate guanylyltransferase
MSKEAIILAGGFGTRLQHILPDLPKPMANVNGKPFLDYLLDRLIAYRFTHVILSTGYLHEKIEHHYGSQYRQLRLAYARERKPLATGGAVAFALSKCRTDHVFVLNGDTLFSIDMDDFSSFYRQKQTAFAMALREVADVARYGSVETDPENRIVRFREKNQQSGKGFINGGVYLMNRNLLDGWDGQPFSFEKDFLEKQYPTQLFHAKPYSAYFIDIGVPEDYARAERELKSS